MSQRILADDGIALVLHEIDAVLADGHRLGLSVLLRHRCIEQVHFSVLLHCGAGKTSARVLVGLVGIEGDGILLPVNQVPAHRMSPVHLPPVGCVRIVLEKRVILSLIENQAVGIVHPPPLRLEMIAKSLCLHRNTSFGQQRCCPLHVHINTEEYNTVLLKNTRRAAAGKPGLPA